MQYRSRKHTQRGVVLIGVLFFILITSMLLMGMGVFAVSHQTRMRADLNYAQALDVAEAGIDYEMRKISLNVATADQSPGASYSFGNGTFTVYCTNQDGSTPWSSNQYLYVVSTGTVNGVSRTVKVSVKGYYPDGKFAIYTLDSISIWRGSSMDINGDIGSNGNLDFTATPNIAGSVYFYGADAGWYNCSPTAYNVVKNPNEVQWPTVNDIANQTVSGGMTTLATTNDNANANPPIVGNSITDSVTLTAGNYYVTNINLTGSKKITFDNSAGPVNLWVGPEGGTGTCRFRGGTSAIPISSDPTKACHIYVGTKSGIDLAGNETIDALIYAYNKDAQGNTYGYAQNSGNPTINGQIIANQVDINGNITVNYKTDLIKPSAFGYFGYDNSWVEVGGR